MLCLGKRVVKFPTTISFVFFFVITATQVNEASAQSGSRGRLIQQGSGVRQQQPFQQQVQETFESKLWNWLKKSQYQNWAPIPGKPGGTYPSEQPHGAHVKLFANRTAAANAETLPHGSILVKENYGPDGTTLMATTVMYRSKGYNPQGGDWYWAKYGANGQISRMQGMPISGKVGTCIECHSSAGGDDFSFANDK